MKNIDKLSTYLHNRESRQTLTLPSSTAMVKTISSKMGDITALTTRGNGDDDDDDYDNNYDDDIDAQIIKLFFQDGQYY